MKSHLLQLLAISSAILLSTHAFADNPLILDQFTADPTARCFEGKIFLFPSHDMLTRPGAWFAMEDYHTFSSENLLDWKDHGVILDQKQVPWVRGGGNSMWAPDCVEKDGKYYFYFPAGSQIGVAIADKPEGPYKVEPQGLVGGIDPCCFIDTAGAKDGKKPDAYLIWKGNPLSIRKLREDMKSLDPAATTVNVRNLPNQGLIEGPFMFERKGKYYLTYPHAVRTAGWEAEQLEYAMGDSPTGPFTVTGIIMDETPNRCWTNHHSLVEYKGQWMLFYHDKDLSPNNDRNRSTRADYLSFNDDGTIQKVIPTLRGVGIADAKRKIQIDRFSDISKAGADVSFLDDAKKGDGWKIALSDKDAFVQYNRVEFGKAELKTVNVRARSSTGGTLQVRLDKLDGPLAAKVEIQKGDEWNVVHTKLATVPSGQHDLVVTMPEKNSVEVDWVSFE
jgi:beta-xylosidase